MGGMFKYAKNINLLALITLVLGGCSFLPVPLQIASWAVDGISVITTQKSISDHGLSLVTQKDCAIWKGFTKGVICREYIKPYVYIAVKPAPTPPLFSTFNSQPDIAKPYLNII